MKRPAETGTSAEEGQTSFFYQTLYEMDHCSPFAI